MPQEVFEEKLLKQGARWTGLEAKYPGPSGQELPATGSEQQLEFSRKMHMPGRMNTVFKGMLLVVGSYVVTKALVALIIVLAIAILMMGSTACSVMNRALVALWVTIAVLFFARVAVVRIVARKVILNIAGRRAAVVIYGVVLLASYVVIALGLMVAFEC